MGVGLGRGSGVRLQMGPDIGRAWARYVLGNGAGHGVGHGAINEIMIDENMCVPIFSLGHNPRPAYSHDYLDI